MMLLAFLVVVIVVGVAAIALDRRWRARQSAKVLVVETPQATDATTSIEDKGRRPFFTRLTGRVGNWRNRRAGRQQQDMRQQFRAWIVKACADEVPLRTWLQQLPEKEEQAFIDEVAAFCTEKGFELPWVVEQRLESYPELAQAAEQVVLHYCRACHQAVAAQQDLDVYKTLLAFEHNPADEKAREFGHKLFAKVIEAGLTSFSMSEYLLAAPQDQRQYMLRAIREAAERHREAFYRLLKEITRDAAATPVTPPPSAPSEATSGTQENATAPEGATVYSS
jgi:hypothetical protein